MEQPQLPPGWRADWNEQYSRYLYTDATGQPTWELPTQQQPPVQPAQPRTHAKPKRAYAAADAYYGGSSGDHAQGQAAPAGQPPQFFSTMGAPQPAPQQPMVGPAPYLDASTRGNIYQQPQAAVQQATQQLSHLSVQSTLRPTINLIQTPLNPAELALPPSEIPLAPEASFSPSPYKNASAKYQRCTINAIPTQQSVLNKSKIPFAIICTPYPSVKTPEDEVPVVKDCVIARCRRCRTYINPFVTWVESSNRWKCCMCGLANETPQMFDYNQQGPANRWERPELNHGVVDFVAPTEYMVRPPQPPVYVFLIDVSYAAIKSGMVATAARTLLESLDRLPNVDDRTKVSIIGVDTCLHFFSLTPGSEDPTMLVVGDLDDVFLPQPTNLLVSLTEARAGLESLLNRINDMFKDNHTVGSALGAGLQAAFKLISAVGGKIFVLTASLPSHGPGALKSREDPKLMGTPKESTLLQPANDFYKKFATDCSRTQVSVDMWIFGASYNDVATLSALPKYTGGQTYLYPAFDAARSEDALKFAHEFATIVTSPFLLEAVLRVRTSRGLRTSSYHGNAFVRSTDLLALSTVTPDQSYAVECQIEETLTTPFVVFQTAVLHTSSFGERRIRVVTQAIPTTTTVSEVFSSVDQVALTTLLANKAVERSLSHKLEDARDALFNKLVDILTVYKANMTSAGSGASPQLVVSENMKFLPILVLGLIKNLALRQSSHIAPDLRAYAQCLLTTLPPQTLIPYIHPTLYSLHDMPEECGTIDENGVILPPPLPLTSERLERYGLFLIEDGQNIFLWVGREAVPQLIQDVFDLPASSELHSGKATLPILDNSFSQRVNAVIGKVREMRRGPYYPHLYVVKEDGDPSLRLWALSALLEDRQEPAPSYIQFLNSVKDKVNGSS